MENKSRSKFKQKCQLVTFYTDINACMYLFLTLFLCIFCHIDLFIETFINFDCFCLQELRQSKFRNAACAATWRHLCSTASLKPSCMCGHGCMRTDSAVLMDGCGRKTWAFYSTEFSAAVTFLRKRSVSLYVSSTLNSSVFAEECDRR